MDWKHLADEAKEVIDKRGGPKSLQEDAEELRDIAQRDESMSDKLKQAAAAIREPGAHKESGAGAQQDAGAQPAPREHGADDQPTAEGQR